MRLVWDESAWEDYKHWQTADRKILKRINTLIDACLRDPFSGIGKPEQLKYGAQLMVATHHRRTPARLPRRR